MTRSLVLPPLLQVISVASFNGGSDLDQIPDLVTLGGTFRAFNSSSLHQLRRRIEEVHTGLHGSHVPLSEPLHLVFILTHGLRAAHKRQVIVEQARVYRCTASVDFFENDFQFYPPTVNDELLAEHVRRVSVDLLGPANYRTVALAMGAEDFSFYAQLVPAAFFYIGIRNETLGSVHSGHSPHFMIDEGVLPVGAATHAAIAERYLRDRHLSLHRLSA